MIRGIRWLLLLSAWLAFACGTQDEVVVDEELGTEQSALPSACTEEAITNSTCSGPWEYQLYNKPCYIQKADSYCPISGYGTMTCYHPCALPQFGIQGKTEVWYFQGLVEPNHCTSWDFFANKTCYYDQSCADVATQWIEGNNGYYGNDLQYTAVSVGSKYWGWGGVGRGGCEVWVYDPIYWTRYNDPACPSYTCTNYNDPKYVACRAPEHGEVSNPAECGVSSVKRYSQPNMTLSGLAGIEGKYLVGTSAVCTTCETLPSSTAAEVQAKYNCLAGKWNDLIAGRLNGARAVDPSLENKLNQNMKELFELKGHLLTRTQRTFILDNMYTLRPDVQASCGTHWQAPPESDPIPASDGFENVSSPLGSWSISGVTSASTTAQAGARSAMVGAVTQTNGESSLRRWFTVPSSGGTLSFWYQAFCPDTVANDWVTVTIQDTVTNQVYEVLPKTCTSTAAWTQVNYSLAAVKGHRVVLKLAVRDNNVAGTATYALFDSVAFPYIPEELESMLRLCHRMGEDHVKAELAEIADATTTEQAMAQRCADTVGWAKNLPSTYPNRAAYLSKAAAVSVNVMNKAFKVVPGADATARKLPIQRHLWTLGRWYANAKSGVYTSDNSGTANEKLWKDTSDIAGAIWKGVYAPSYASFKSSRDIAAYRTAGLAADREMFDALFSDYTLAGSTTKVTPLNNAPALFLLSDTFKAMSERLDSVAPYHDMGCRFLDCATSGKKTELSHLYAILGKLPDETAFRQEVDAGEAAYNDSLQRSHFSANWPIYRDLFKKVFEAPAANPSVTRHVDVIQSAVKDARASNSAYNPQTMVLDVSPADPGPLVAFSGLVQAAAKRAENFRNTGLLAKAGAKSLPTGLLSSTLDRVRSAVTTAQVDLDKSISTYQSNQRALVDDLINEIDVGVLENNLETRKQALSTRAYNLAMDNAALKSSASADLARFADQNRQMDVVMDTLRARGNELVTEQTLGPITVNGQGGRYPLSSNGPVSNVASVALQLNTGPNGRLLEGKPGEVLNLTISGSYQPSCALQAVAQDGKYLGYPINPLTEANSSLADAETGSGGYYFEWASGEFKVKSQQVTTSVAEDLSVRGCLGPQTPFGSIQACLGYSENRISSETDNSGKDARNTAAFALGVRLPRTPFPNYPAGALLAVLVKPGVTLASDILDIQVLQQPHTTITFGRPADVYLVVNDRDCGSAGTSKTLTVSGVKLVPVTGVMTQVATAMQKFEEYLRVPSAGSTDGKADSLVKQGRLLPSDIAALRNTAWQQLRTACGACDPMGLPGVVRGFFETWLDLQVLHIEREIEHISIAREMDHVMLEARALERDIEMMDRKGRLAGLMPHWSLRNLELSNAYLKQSTETVARMVSDQLHPMVFLRYPEALSGLTYTERLLGLDWVGEPLGTTVSSGSLAGKVKLATDEIMSKLTIAVNNSTSPTSPTRDSVEAYAVVRFPDPFRVPLTSLAGFAGRMADESRARMVWAPILKYFETGCPMGAPTCVSDPIEISIRPSDLYQNGITNGLLGCNFVAPTIKDMAIFLVTDSPTASNWSTNDIKSPTSALSPMSFPTASGIQEFHLENEDFLKTGRTKLYYGKEEAWKTGFDALTATDLSESVRGVSPFTSFTLSSFAGYGDPWFGFQPDQTKDLMVVMRIEARQKSPGVKGVPTCP
ncbi:hypothetical protein ACN28E_39035 [Archangium lansingense]|uniref:hypothetical protein n=1 Tax=Archangium lansingense TaxID=2995310 RepID=UPI003B7D14DA